MIARATMGTVFLVVAAQIAGLMFGWWTMAWAGIAGTALAIVALGLIVQALRGRMLSLIGPGVLFSFLTVGLALTGLSGPARVGNITWNPGSAAAVQSEYQISTGEGFLDLTHLNLDGDVVNTSVTVGAGRAVVMLPSGTNLNVTCTSNVGEVHCVDFSADGFRNEQTFTDNKPTYVTAPST